MIPLAVDALIHIMGTVLSLLGFGTYNAALASATTLVSI